MRWHLRAGILTEYAVTFAFWPLGLGKEVSFGLASDGSMVNDNCSRLQVAEVRSQRASQDSAGSRVESSGMDAGETSNNRVRRYRI